MPVRPRLAVLIDAERVTASFAHPLLEHLGGRALLTVKRAYGDWATHLHGWVAVLDRHGIEPVQRFHRPMVGSNLVVSMTIDALDLLRTERAEGFAIVGGDDAAIPLATRLRADGAVVLGAVQGDVPVAFAAACSEFLRLEDLATDLGAHRGPVRDYRGRHRADDTTTSAPNGR